MPLAPFHTPLDREETTEGVITLDNDHAVTGGSQSLHQSFRHSFWARRRTTTCNALQALYPLSPRVRRFKACGASAWVLKSLDNPPLYRIRTNRCHDRFCEACNVEKRRLVAWNLARNLPSQHLRLLTLTLKHTAQPLSDQINRLYTCFRKFRNRKPIARLLTGGIYFLELTTSDKTGLWHPHLHVICTGRYLPKDLLAKHWLSSTGDSYVLDIRYIRSPGHAAGYIVKYAGKALSPKVWKHPERFAEAIQALSHRRTFHTFGTFKNLALSKPPDDDHTWVVIGTLDTFIKSGIEGSPIARDIMNHLRIRLNHTPQDYDDST